MRNVKSWFPHDEAAAGIPHIPARGLEVWRLVDNYGCIQSCELRDDSVEGGGWDVIVLLEGEPLFSRRCTDEGTARFLATAWQQDNLRGGWQS